MGWTSTADPLENVGRATLLFHTKEEAIAFCQKHGWEAQVRHGTGWVHCAAQCLDRLGYCLELLQCTVHRHM